MAFGVNRRLRVCSLGGNFAGGFKVCLQQLVSDEVDSSEGFLCQVDSSSASRSIVGVHKRRGMLPSARAKSAPVLGAVKQMTLDRACGAGAAL